MRHLYAGLPIIVSAVGLFVAYQAWQQFERGDHGNALISAATALALTLAPHLPFTKEMFIKDLKDVANEAVRNPLPLKFRLVIALCWGLMISGFVIVLLK